MDYPHLIPVKTRVMVPPQDDLLAVMDEFLPPLVDGDVLCVTSKVVSIDEGRCVKGDMAELVKQEADRWLPGHLNNYGLMLTQVHHAIIVAAGIDQSNSNGYLTLLPKDPCASAARLRQALMNKFGLKRLGVIITDSHVLPLRWGTCGVAIGVSGLQLLRDYRGSQDLFGYTMKVSQSNMIDPLAAAAVNIMGEGTEQVPMVIVRNWPGVVFTDAEGWQDFVIEPRDDVYWPLLRVFEDNTE